MNSSACRSNDLLQQDVARMRGGLICLVVICDDCLSIECCLTGRDSRQTMGEKYLKSNPTCSPATWVYLNNSTRWSAKGRSVESPKLLDSPNAIDTHTHAPYAGVSAGWPIIAAGSELAVASWVANPNLGVGSVSSKRVLHFQFRRAHLYFISCLSQTTP